jgi:Ribbon-helix-helix protein, copG family
MPRPGPRRPAVTIRLDPDHAEWLVKEAERRGVSQGHILRELIDAERNQPQGATTA